MATLITVDVGNVDAEDFRCEYDYEHKKWSDQTYTNGPITVPYAFHWTVPDDVKAQFKYWLNLMHEDIGCVNFLHVEDAMNNEWDNGALVLWNSREGDYDHCSSCIGQCTNYKRNFDDGWKYVGPNTAPPGTKFTDDGNFRLIQEKGKSTEGDTMKPNWQYIRFSYDCFRWSTVQHEFMHVLAFLHEQAHTDRDNYLYLNRENLMADPKRSLSNYQKVQEKAHANSPYPFELGSVMMYSPRVYGTEKADDGDFKEILDIIEDEDGDGVIDGSVGMI